MNFIQDINSTVRCSRCMRTLSVIDPASERRNHPGHVSAYMLFLLPRITRNVSNVVHAPGTYLGSNVLFYFTRERTVGTVE